MLLKSQFGLSTRVHLTRAWYEQSNMPSVLHGHLECKVHKGLLLLPVVVVVVDVVVVIATAAEPTACFSLARPVMFLHCYGLVGMPLYVMGVPVIVISCLMQVIQKLKNLWYLSLVACNYLEVPGYDTVSFFAKWPRLTAIWMW